jgi:polysaccharide biosynthesis/export protein
VVDFFGIIDWICRLFVDLVSHRTGSAKRFSRIANGEEIMNRKKLMVVALAVCSAAGMRGQVVGSATGQATELGESSQAWGNNLGFEPVGSGDLVYISVAGSPELSRSSRVTADGKLMLPLLREGVPVSGLTPSRIADVVSAALVKEKVLVDPIVSASVLEYRSRRVSVVGAVRLPCSFQAIGGLRLLDAIARAQGTSPEAGPEVIVSFPGDKDGEKSALHVPIRALLAAKDPSLNIVLLGGEEIRVPEAQKLFIVGNVRLPGSYPLADPDGSTVLKALALSQGSLPFSAKRAYIYRLIADSGKREEIPVELREILHRKRPDVRLEASDILYIPDNPKTRLTAAALDRMTGFGSSVAAGLVVWH